MKRMPLKTTTVVLVLAPMSAFDWRFAFYLLGALSFG